MHKLTINCDRVRKYTPAPSLNVLLIIYNLYIWLYMHELLNTTTYKLKINCVRKYTFAPTGANVLLIIYNLVMISFLSSMGLVKYRILDYTWNWIQLFAEVPVFHVYLRVST